MARVQKLPRGIDEARKGEYRVRITVDGVRHTVGIYSTLRDAKAAQDIALGEKARGVFVPPADERAERRRQREEAERAKFTVGDLAKEWISWLERSGRKRSTVYTYESRINAHVLPTMRDIPVSDVTPARIADWFDTLDREHGNGVARPAYLAMSSMFTYATGKAKGQPRGFVPHVAVSPCSLPGATTHKPVKEKTRQVATPDEVSALAGGMPDHMALAVLLAAWCGLRQGEVLGLHRGDFRTLKHDGVERLWVDISRQMQTKGGLREDTPKSEAGTRLVPVPDGLATVVKNHLRDYAGMGSDGLVFPRTPHGDVVVHPNSLRAAFERSRDALNAERAKKKQEGLPGFTFHMLRHTALTSLGEAGATLAELQEFGGHSEARTVMKYQHASRDRLAALAGVMGADVKVPSVGTVTELETARKEAQ